MKQQRVEIRVLGMLELNGEQAELLTAALSMYGAVAGHTFNDDQTKVHGELLDSVMRLDRAGEAAVRAALDSWEGEVGTPSDEVMERYREDIAAVLKDALSES